MIRKLLLTLTVLFVLPTFANAWYVNAKTSPATGQGTISPSGNQSYPAGQNSGEYTVTPAPGYTVFRVTLDGANISPNANGKYVAPYVASKAWRYMVAYFSGTTVSITTQITGGSGAIREDTYESLTNIPVGSNRQLLVLPNPGYAIATVTAAGATSIIDNPDGTKTVIYTNLQASQTVSASFALIPVVTVSAGQDVTANGAGAEFAATLYGSATSNQGTITYAWSGAGLSFGTPDAAITTVYAATPGTYTATLTVTSGGIVRQDSATVTVLDHTEYLEEFCTSCHLLNTPQVVSAYDASAHKPNQVSCQDCHTSTPHTEVKPSCLACHSPGNSWGLPWPPTGLSFHNAYTETNRCLDCHDTHNPGIITIPYPHFGSFTTAQYVTTNISCPSCHISAVDNSFNIYSANVQWERGGKANPKSESWNAFDFKTKGTPAPATSANSVADDCVKCHTTTGFINYVTSDLTDIHAWGTSGLAPGGDRTKEMVACNACHNNATGFDASFSRRVVGIVAPGRNNRQVWAYYGYSSGASGKNILTNVLANKGESNLCIVCHIGKVSGQNIQDAAAVVGTTGPFWSNVSFISSHNMASAALLFQDYSLWPMGYEYRTDTSVPVLNFAHPAIGDAQLGPCIVCHMSGSDKKHLFTPVSTATNGDITSITSTTCFLSNCHVPESFTASFLQSKKTGYQAALAVVAAQLAIRGIYFNASQYPYFFDDQSFTTPTMNWNRTIDGSNFGSDIMGAAFNLKLLQSDGGAYTHNDWYTKRILYDTLDFLDDGLQNDTANIAIQNLGIDQGVKDHATAYIGVRP